MTLNTTGLTESFSGNGVTTAFSFPYRFLEDDDLIVTLIDDSSGVETVQTLTTDYTVTGAGDPSGGTVTMNTAPASGETLFIRRTVELVQETDYISGDPFPAQTHETAIDRLTMITQQLDEAFNRSVRLSSTDTSGADPVLPVPTALHFIRWNSSANALESVAVANVGDLVVTAFIETLLDDPDASTARVTLGLVIGTDVQAFDATLAAFAGALTAANKIPYATGVDTLGELDFLDEDTMSSNSATGVPSQQSVKAYVDNRGAEVTGSATFTNSTNNIAITGIGSIGLEIGDVITVTGSTNNDTEYTIDVITDNDNIIVNQAHAGGSTSKSLTDETATVTVSLLCKANVAPLGLGLGLIDVTASRSMGVTYTNNRPRATLAIISVIPTASGVNYVDVIVNGDSVAEIGQISASSPETRYAAPASVPVQSGETVSATINSGSVTLRKWVEYL